MATLQQQCYARISKILRDAQKQLSQLPDGPEQAQIQQILAQMERIADERLLEESYPSQ